MERTPLNVRDKWRTISNKNTNKKEIDLGYSLEFI
jgi:hypothetical protein